MACIIPHARTARTVMHTSFPYILSDRQCHKNNDLLGSQCDSVSEPRGIPIQGVHLSPRNVKKDPFLKCYCVEQVRRNVSIIAVSFNRILSDRKWMVRYLHRLTCVIDNACTRRAVWPTHTRPYDYMGRCNQRNRPPKSCSCLLKYIPCMCRAPTWRIVH